MKSKNDHATYNALLFPADLAEGRTCNNVFTNADVTNLRDLSRLKSGSTLISHDKYESIADNFLRK